MKVLQPLNVDDDEHLNIILDAFSATNKLGHSIIDTLATTITLQLCYLGLGVDAVNRVMAVLHDELEAHMKTLDMS